MLKYENNPPAVAEKKCWYPRNGCEFYWSVIWIVLVPLAGLIAGAVILSMGISDKASSKDLDASVDFTQLPFTCTITEAVSSELLYNFFFQEFSSYFAFRTL